MLIKLSQMVVASFGEYLLSAGFSKQAQRDLEKDIVFKISRFNEEFADKDVDSIYFVEFLEKQDVINAIIDSVFRAYEPNSINYMTLAESIPIEAFEFVNFKKKSFNHPLIETPKQFQQYFEELFQFLISFRSTLISFEEKVALTISTETTEKSTTAIIEAIENLKEYDYLLEVELRKISLLNDKGLSGDALESISSLFEVMERMSNNQKIELFYQKFRALLKAKEPTKLESVYEQVKRLDSKSLYLYKMDYWIGYINLDSQRVKDSLLNLKGVGFDQDEVDLKESNFQLILKNFAKVTDLILDDNNTIKPRFINNRQAFSQLGFVAFENENFKEAKIYFDKAKAIKYNIIDDYHSVLATSVLIFETFDILSHVTKELEEEAKVLYRNFKRIEYFIHGESKESRIQHFRISLKLLELIDLKLAMERIDEIDEDLESNVELFPVISEIYFLFGSYELASEYLERIWRQDPVFLYRLLYCYRESDDWRKIEMIFEQDLEELYDEDGAVLSFEIQLNDKNKQYEKVKNLITDNIEKYRNSQCFLTDSLTYLHKYRADDDYEMVLKYVSELPKNTEAFGRNDLARTLIGHNRHSLARSLLLETMLFDDNALELYLGSYGDINLESDYFDEVKKVVSELYSKGKRNQYLLQIKVFIEILTARYLISIDSLSEYKKLYGSDSFYNVQFIQCTTLGYLDNDASIEAIELLKSNSLEKHIIVAQFYSYKGLWDEGRTVLRNSFYRFDEQISEKELAEFIRIFLNNSYQDKNNRELSEIRDDTAAILQGPDNEIINICIHSNNDILGINGEEKFNCINFMSTSNEALVLKATGTIGKNIEFNHRKYLIKEVLDIDTYFFRYYLIKIQQNYPDNKNIIPIKAKTPKEMIDKIKVILKESNEEIDNRLALYNSTEDLGVPLMFLSGKDANKYLDTIYFLLNDDDNMFLSVYSDDVSEREKYVLTLSSLVVLHGLKLLHKIKEISAKIIIPSSVELFVRRAITDSIKYSSVMATAFLSKDEEFVLKESTEETKIFKKDFWSTMLIIINGFEVVKPEAFDTTIYEEIHEIVDISEFDSIALSEQKNAVLVCDDLFISKISGFINNDALIVNVITLIYQEKLIEINELVQLILDLTNKRFMNCVNDVMLFDIYLHLLESKETDSFEILKEKAFLIFDNLFGIKTENFNDRLYTEFIELAVEKTPRDFLLYELIQKPKNLKPLGSLLDDLY